MIISTKIPVKKLDLRFVKKITEFIDNLLFSILICE